MSRPYVKLDEPKLPPKDFKGNEIKVGGRVFVQRHAPSAPVVKIEESKSKGFYWIYVSCGPHNGVVPYFDISVLVDDGTPPPWEAT